MNELNVLLRAVAIAGKAILSLQKTNFSVNKKANNEIVTEADLLANDILQTQLKNKFPEDGWLSEESVDDNSRLSCQRTWIVDPIDGTREYANGIPEYAISVALVEAGAPVLACVFNPASDEFFYAIKNKGAWLGGQQIHCSLLSEKNYLILASRSEYQRGEWQRFQSHAQIKPIGSIAYKLGLVAAGCAHATFSLNPKHDWDIAAGALLVTEAGGMVTDKYGKPFVFNSKNVKQSGIVATTKATNRQIFTWLNYHNL